MPWILKDDCVGCEICIKNCPSGAIKLIDKKAEILMKDCIRCGTCHSICPKNAVKHDKEQIPSQVLENLNLTEKNVLACEKFFGTKQDGLKCFDKMLRYFNKEKFVIEKTIEEIKFKKEEFKKKYNL